MKLYSQQQQDFISLGPIFNFPVLPDLNIPAAVKQGHKSSAVLSGITSVVPRPLNHSDRTVCSPHKHLLNGQMNEWIHFLWVLFQCSSATLFEHLLMSGVLWGIETDQVERKEQKTAWCSSANILDSKWGQHLGLQDSRCSLKLFWAQHLQISFRIPETL